VSLHSPYPLLPSVGSNPAVSVSLDQSLNNRLSFFSRSQKTHSFTTLPASASTNTILAVSLETDLSCQSLVCLLGSNAMQTPIDTDNVLAPSLLATLFSFLSTSQPRTSPFPEEAISQAGFAAFSSLSPSLPLEIVAISLEASSGVLPLLSSSINRLFALVTLRQSGTDTTYSCEVEVSVGINGNIELVKLLSSKGAQPWREDSKVNYFL
jgi:hypothetical protein